MTYDQLISRLRLSGMPNAGPGARFGIRSPTTQLQPPPNSTPMGPYAAPQTGASLPMAKTVGGILNQARQVGAMNRAMGISPVRSVSSRAR